MNIFVLAGAEIMTLGQLAPRLEHEDTLHFVERILTSIHVCAYTVPKMCEYTKMSEERAQRLVRMLEKNGFIRRVDEYLWLTEKGKEWREFLKRILK